MNAGFVLLGISYLQSLHVQPWFSWSNEVVAFAAAIWLSVAIFRRSSNQRLLEVPWVAIALAGLLPLIAAQVAFGLITYRGDAVVLTTYVCLCSVSVCAGYWAKTLSVAHKRASVEDALSIMLVVVGVASVFIALVQAVGSDILREWVSPPVQFRRPGANLGQPNHLATLLLMGFVAVVYRRVKGQFGFVLFAVLAGLLLFGVAITESRTALLSMLALTGWWLLKRRAIQSPFGLKTVLTGWAFLLLAVWVWPTVLTALHSGGLEQFVPARSVNSTPGARAIVWSQLTQAVLTRPWFGWGLRGVSKAHNAVLDAYTDGEPFTYAHNIVLDLAIGAGIPIALLLVCAVGWWLYRRLTLVNSPATWFLVGTIIPVAVHSLLEFPFAYAYFLVPTMIAVGALEASTNTKKVSHIPRPAIALLLSIYSLLLIWILVEYAQIEEDFRVARFEALHIGSTPADYVRPTICLLTQLDAMLDATRVVPRSNMDPQEILRLRDAALHFPWTAVQNRYALSLALNGNAAEARRQMLVMRAMHGEKTYHALMENWRALADTKYPLLQEFIN
jgi:O-antigen ligase